MSGNGNGIQPRLKVGHCNICGAVLAIKEHGEGPFDPDDPMLRQHADWHRATFTAIDLALARGDDVWAAKARERLEKRSFSAEDEKIYTGPESTA